MIGPPLFSSLHVTYANWRRTAMLDRGAPRSYRAPVPTALPLLVAMLGIACFACMDAIMKGQAIAIGALAALLWRSVFGFGASALLFAGTRRAWPPRERLVLHLKRSAAAAASILLFFWGLARTPLAEGTALTFLAPIIAALLAALLLGERLRKGALLGSLLAFGGVVLIVAVKSRGEAGGNLAGAGAIICASVLYAYNLVLLRASAQAADPVEITFFTNLVMLVLFAVVSPWFGAWPDAHGWKVLPAAAALQVVSSMLLAWAYARAEAQLLGLSEYTAFVWAGILGWLVYREPVTVETVAGAILIAAGCLVATRRERARAVQSEAAL